MMDFADSMDDNESDGMCALQYAGIARLLGEGVAMRADKTKSRTTWASLLCLASVGCVQHQHVSSPKGPLTSSQSGRGWQQAGLTSNTGRVAVVNDPSQWPERPSSEAVKSKFNELFPNLAQRQEPAARVQIGRPEAEEQVAAAKVEKIADPAESLPQVVEARRQPEPMQEPAKQPTVEMVESRLLAKLSQQSAGAISAVAAMVSMQDEATVKASDSNGPVSERVATGKEPVNTFSPDVTKPDVKPESPSANTLAGALPGIQEPTPPARPSLAEMPVVPGVPWDEVKPVPVAEKPTQAAATQVVVADQPVVTAVPPVQAGDLLVVPAIPAGVQLAGVPELKQPDRKVSIGNSLSPAAELPDLTAQQAREPAKSVATAPLQEKLEPPAPLPVVPAIPMKPVLASIPEQAVPVTQTIEKEALPPPLTAEEVLARKNLQPSPAAPATPLAGARALADLPATIPALPQVSEATKTEELTEKQVAAAPVEPAIADRLALAPSELPKVPALPVLADQKSNADPLPKDVEVPRKLPVDAPQVPPLKEDQNVVDEKKALKVHTPPAGPAANDETAPKSVIDLPPPAPAPELQVPGLSEPLKPPAETAVEKTSLNPSADKGVERSSAAQAVEPPASAQSDAMPEVLPLKPAEPALNRDLSTPSGAEATVPVLTPLPDDQANHAPTETSPRSREIVIRLTIPKPSHSRFFTSKNQQEGGVQGLRTAAAGMFDWRKRLGAGYQQPPSASVALSPLALKNQVAATLPSVSLIQASAAETDAATDVPKPLLAVEPYQTRAQVTQSGLPPVTFPSTYRQRPSANPWANHQSPAVNMVAAPPAPVPNPQPSVKQEVAAVQAKPAKGPAQRSGDSAIVPISYAALSRPSATEPTPPPASAPDVQVGSRSWISRAQKGLRSFWGGSDEVVPPRRQDWASRVAAAQDSGISPKSFSLIGDRLNPEMPATGRLKPLRASEN